MAETKLQKECVRYLNSEGIYYTKNKTSTIACINGVFVNFEFGDTPASRKLMASGGVYYRPCSLQDFIEKVRSVQRGIEV